MKDLEITVAPLGRNCSVKYQGELLHVKRGTIKMDVNTVTEIDLVCFNLERTFTFKDQFMIEEPI